MTLSTRAAAADIDEHEIIKNLGHRQAASLDAYTDDSAAMAYAKECKLQDSMCVHTHIASETANTCNSNSPMTAALH